jgi:hypothetical protein
VNLKRTISRTAMFGAIVLGALATTPVLASTVVLDFAGLNGNSQESVQNFYNGGTGSLGSGPGVNYGITFSSNALACSGQPGGTCNTAQIPGGPGANALFFLSGAAANMTVAGGFDTGFSFYYSAVNNPGSVAVYDGADGTGNILATIALPTTADGAGIPGCFGANFCPYSAVGVAFSGTALSVAFAGAQNQIAFADVTFGSATAGGTIPEPASFALVGLSLLGLAVARRRKST